jgi:hypothetical protein
LVEGGGGREEAGKEMERERGMREKGHSQYRHNPVVIPIDR